jgi:hypothetical protein
MDFPKEIINGYAGVFKAHALASDKMVLSALKSEHARQVATYKERRSEIVDALEASRSLNDLLTDYYNRLHAMRGVDGKCADDPYICLTDPSYDEKVCENVLAQVKPALNTFLPEGISDLVVRSYLIGPRPDPFPVRPGAIMHATCAMALSRQYPVLAWNTVLAAYRWKRLDTNATLGWDRVFRFDGVNILAVKAIGTALDIHPELAYTAGEELSGIPTELVIRIRDMRALGHHGVQLQTTFEAAPPGTLCVLSCGMPLEGMPLANLG